MIENSTSLCPWCGLPCDCTEFPYIIDGVIPIKCGERIVKELPYLYPIRKITDDQKIRAKERIRIIEEELKLERMKEKKHG